MDSKRAVKTFGLRANKSGANDLKIEDADESELLDGFDKRIEKIKSNNEMLSIKNMKNAKTSSKCAKSPIEPSSQKASISSETFYTIKSASKQEETIFVANKKQLELEHELGKKLEIRSDLKHELLITDIDSRKSENLNKFKEDSDKHTTSIKVNSTNKSIPSSSSSSTLSNQISSAHIDSSKQIISDQPSSYTTQPIDFETAKELRMLLFGCLNQSFNDDWKIQNFGFCDYAKLKFGIVQKKGGPCGVLACLQAYVLFELIFANENEIKDLNSIFNVPKRNRSQALAKAIVRILNKCSTNGKKFILTMSTPQSHFAPKEKYKSDGVTETLNLLHFNDLTSLEGFVLKNVHLLEADGSSSCLLLLYSAILSRTISEVKKDMDDSSSRLIGKHDYCTQEMVNLLLHGRAVSNVFNDSMLLDKLELRGPNRRNEIGFLSLFEHYKSCEVGSYYKTPKYPIWVVCSESHFSVLFALRKDILNDWKAESIFDLYYYDGLAKQDEQIRLTISSKKYDQQDSFIASLYRNKKEKAEKDLTPPLEYVIRTKWKDAAINWNSSQPIL